MHIVARYGKFKQDGDNLVHAELNDAATQRYVGAVDVLYFDQNNLPAYATQSFNKEKVTITINYCKSGNCDAATLETDQNGKGLKFGAGKDKPKDDDKPLPSVVSHKPPDGKIKDIKVKGSAPYGCGPDGRCWLAEVVKSFETPVGIIY
jgi:hypothetical protein